MVENDRNYFWWCEKRVPKGKQYCARLPSLVFRVATVDPTLVGFIGECGKWITHRFHHWGYTLITNSQAEGWLWLSLFLLLFFFKHGCLFGSCKSLFLREEEKKTWRSSIMKESCSLSLVLPITGTVQVFLPSRDIFCLKKPLPDRLEETWMVLREATPERLWVSGEGSWWRAFMTLVCFWQWHVIGLLERKGWLGIKPTGGRLQMIPVFSSLSWHSSPPSATEAKGYFSWIHTVTWDRFSQTFRVRT